MPRVRAPRGTRGAVAPPCSWTYGREDGAIGGAAHCARIGVSDTHGRRAQPLGPRSGGTSAALHLCPHQRGSTLQ